jgi:Protein of unknown function (DUF4242)
MVAAAMKAYRVELHLPVADPASLAVAGERARAAVEDLAREGATVHWIRSVYVAEDDMCLLVFEARSPEAVGEASRRATLEFERIGARGGSG